MHNSTSYFFQAYNCFCGLQIYVQHVHFGFQLISSQIILSEIITSIWNIFLPKQISFGIISSPDKVMFSGVIVTVVTVKEIFHSFMLKFIKF